MEKNHFKIRRFGVLKYHFETRTALNVLFQADETKKKEKEEEDEETESVCFESRTIKEETE